ncbi:zinc finger, CCHC-type containing protein [Tanacetum coccineum]
MDHPEITMEEYIQLEAEKARGRDSENEFLAIVYKDALTFEPEVSYEPTVHYLVKLPVKFLQTAHQAFSAAAWGIARFRILFSLVGAKRMLIPRTSVRGSKLKLMDSLDLDVANRERMRLRLFQFSLRDQARNWLERLPAGSISTWEDLTTRFLAQFFPPGRATKICNDILMFKQHQGESLFEA